MIAQTAERSLFIGPTKRRRTSVTFQHTLGTLRLLARTVHLLGRNQPPHGGSVAGSYKRKWLPSNWRKTAQSGDGAGGEPTGWPGQERISRIQPGPARKRQSDGAGVVYEHRAGLSCALLGEQGGVDRLPIGGGSLVTKTSARDTLS